ncbi:MAG: XrtA/PEP-CTERM system exopolysaccharide export protein [Pseudomonadota bacterium]
MQPPDAAAPTTNTDEIDLSERGAYLIGVDDTVRVSVWRNEDLSVEVPVRPDGYISVPLIGEVAAGGRPAYDVARDIERKLSKFIRQPQVSVILTSLVSHEFLSRVRVTGAVRNPISMPYRPGMTVLDLVLESGGINEFAVAQRAKLYRRHADGSNKTYSIKLGSILNEGDLRSNYALQPGDVITVPERKF